MNFDDNDWKLMGHPPLQPGESLEDLFQELEDFFLKETIPAKMPDHVGMEIAPSKRPLTVPKSWLN